MYSVFAFCQNLTYVNINNANIITSTLGMFYGCINLTTLDLTNWDTSSVTDMSYMFSNCSNLSYINMNNSDYNSVNKIIEQLPTRTSDSMGTLNIEGVDDISQVDTTTAESKFWNII